MSVHTLTRYHAMFEVRNTYFAMHAVASTHAAGNTYRITFLVVQLHAMRYDLFLTKEGSKVNAAGHVGSSAYAPGRPRRSVRNSMDVTDGY